MFRTLTAAVLALVFASASIAPSFAIGWAPQSVRPLLDTNTRLFISMSRPAMAPLGFVVFCAKHPEECTTQEAGDDHVRMTVGVKWILASVTRRINRTVVPVSDGEGDVDVWTVGRNAGDCEDSALAKRAELLRLGFPPAALRLGIAVTRGGIGHAVLIVRTSAGDLVLDNRNDSVRSWHKTDLSWVKVQSGRDPRRWFTV